MTADEVVDQFASLLGEQEELDPRLTSYLVGDDLFGLILKHPLVFSIPYTPVMNAMLNRQLEAKMARIEEAAKAQDWSTFIWMHERPYRLQAFMQMKDGMENADYWRLLSRIWQDSENITEQRGLWHRMLSSTREGVDAMMTEDEYEALEALPSTITVYQGRTNSSDDGWSWTTDESVAVWFANRFSTFTSGRQRPQVDVGTVAKIDVLAYLLGRNESEIIAPRTTVTITRSYVPREDA